MNRTEHIRPQKKGRKRHRVLRVILGIFLVALAFTVALCAYWLRDLPSTDTITDYQVSQTTTVYANDKKTVLAKFYLQDRRPVALDKISQNAVAATLATEDNRFYNHGAVDLIGLTRALVNNALHIGDRQGASTITQQLVRNTILIDEASQITVKRKVREAALAIQLEQNLSKDEILNLYLNTINYGDNCYGIEAAARHYFSKSAKDLTILEAATLVGVPQSPNAYAPTANADACKNRRNIVLQRLVDTGRLDQAKADELKAKKITLKLAKESSSTDGIYKYPYFTSYVRDQLLNQMGVKGVYEGGLKVYTTIDPTLQADAEAACAAQYEQWYGNTDNEIALVSIDPSNGFIKAMVGGKDFRADQFNLATQASRQAGSSFKVFTLTAAIEQGINPYTLLDCTSPAQLGNWKVENINNNNYGIRSIQSALAVSSNTGFARLVQAVGADKVVDVAERMGITSQLEPVDSITLGVSGVSPLEMADAYATFANGGIQHNATSITKVVDAHKQTVYQWKEKGTRAISSEVCYAATRCMETVFTQGTAIGARLYSGQVAAGKTGTSENYRDHWLCGFTPQLSTAVWIGSREEQSLPGLDCCFVWRTYMESALAGKELKQFPTANEPEYNNEFNASQYQKYAYIFEKPKSSKKKKKEEQTQTTQTTATRQGGNYSYTDENGNVYRYDQATGNYVYRDGNGGTYSYDENSNTLSYSQPKKKSNG